MSSLVSFTIEAWTYLAIDLVVVGVRVVARWRQMGIRNLSPDDFLMVIAGVSPSRESLSFQLTDPSPWQLLYTAETATAHYVGAYWQGMANSG